MNELQNYYSALTRRHFFGQGALGLGTAALASLMGEQAQGAKVDSEFANPARVGGLPSLPHFAPKAKRAIYLLMAGAPSQIDFFDHKPKLSEMFDKDLPESVRNGQRLMLKRQQNW